MSAEVKSDQWKVSFLGLGPVKIGMKVETLKTIVGDKIKRDDFNGEDCYFFYQLSPASEKAKVGYMIQKNRVARIDVIDAVIETISGARIGTSESVIQALYHGRVRSEPHHYEGLNGWHYLIVESGRTELSAFALLFETDGHKVLNYRVGRREAVQLVEGCQ